MLISPPDAERLSLDGKVIVVTGAARGIGRAHARTLAARGARVVVNDVNGAEECRERLHSDGLDITADGSDIASWDGARALVGNVLAQFGCLDGVVNNAGVLRRSDVADLQEADVDLELAVNLKGTIACTRFASEYWRQESRAGRRRAASVVHTTSDTIFTAAPGGSGYAATKAAIVAFTQSASLEGRQYGVRHNAIAPSGRTPMQAGSGLLAFDGPEPALPEDQEISAPDNPLHNSPLVVWLMSDESRHVSGQVFRLRHGAFARLDTPNHGAWHCPLDGAAAWSPDEIGQVMSDRVFATTFPAPLRHFPGQPSVPFMRLDHR